MTHFEQQQHTRWEVVAAICRDDGSYRPGVLVVRGEDSFEMLGGPYGRPDLMHALLASAAMNDNAVAP